ncbi:sensor histidine kinase [Bacillus sp. EB01]|uniref:sensor histidine kinase n=1 Tax=Bacillus sp. EB01 TaxID=1347086 RepID=UPI0005C6BF9A|nr:sensor histidine kinase [Bacillus sp. EB01]
MSKIQKKIWMHAITVLFIMASIWGALTFYNQKTQTQYNDILERYLSLNEVTISSQKLITDVNDYLIKSSKENFEEVIKSKGELRSAKYKVFALKNDENDFELTNIVNLIDSLIETVDRSLLFQTENETEASLKEFSEATRITGYISDTTLVLLDKELKTYESFYHGIIQQSNDLRTLGIWLMLLITFLMLAITYWFSRSITKPVLKLTQAANELSKGRFDLKIDIKSNDEIAFLGKTFDRMRININNLISEIREKALLERELQENKLLLQESQLRTLQSQINPHFLFNTLNILSKKAYLEGAEETSDLLVNVAGLLRYNLKRIDTSVTLGEEADVLQQYIEIQKARFTERLQFYKEIDESCLDIQIPGLTLQPIVENAVIHAIEPRENGGSIWFRVVDGGEWILIELEDDGPGMAADTIRSILEELPVKTDGQSTGIGFSNVIQRLRLFYGQQDVMEILSNKDKGTKIVLKIPKTKENQVA